MKESLPDWPKFCRSGSAVRHLFWRLCFTGPLCGVSTNFWQIPHREGQQCIALIVLWTNFWTNSQVVYEMGCLKSHEKSPESLDWAWEQKLGCQLTQFGLVMPHGDIELRLTLAQIMACCLMAPSHYLNQCCPLISEVLWHSLKSNFTANAQATILYDKFENHTFPITATSPKG